MSILVSRRLLLTGVAILGVLLVSTFGYNYYQQQLMVQRSSEIERSTFYFGTTLTVSWLDSSAACGQIETVIGKQIYDTLLEYDPDSGKIVPALAESLPTVSPDGLTYTFRLRKGIMFHDGTALSAQTVVDQFFRTRDDSSSVANSVAFRQINVNQTRQIDQYTVEFHLFRAFSPALALFASPCGVSIGSSAHHDRSKDEYVGTGAWKFDHWTRDVEIVLTRNDAYWKKDIPKLKTLVFKFYKELSTMVLDLKAHKLDSTYPTIPASDIQTFKSDNRFTVSSQVTGQMFGFYLNQRFKPLDDVRVRQAFAYSANRTEIIARVYQGSTATAELSIMPDLFHGYSPTFKKYSYNTEMAKQLLADAGYTNGIDVTLSYSTREPNDPNLAVVLQSQLAKSGIRLKLQAMEHSAFIDAHRKGQLQMIILHWIYDYYDGANYLVNFLANSGLGGRWASFYSYSNPQADRLVETMLKTSDDTTRLSLYGQLQDLAADTVPYVPLGSDVQYLIAWNTAQGLRLANPYFATSWALVTKAN